MKPRKNIIIAAIFLIFPLSALAEQFSLSPSTTGKRDSQLGESVGWKTGCAMPDLSKSTKAGTAKINVFLNRDGTTKKIELESSTGSTEENKIISETLKNCKYYHHNGEPQRFPMYFYKTLTFNWPVGNNKPRIGLQRCMRLSHYPSPALHSKIEGTVVWAVRPTDTEEFEKKLVTSSGAKILDEHTKRELNKCLQNPDIIKSIRENFMDGKWDEYRAEYHLKK